MSDKGKLQNSEIIQRWAEMVITVSCFAIYQYHQRIGDESELDRWVGNEREVDRLSPRAVMAFAVERRMALKVTSYC